VLHLPNSRPEGYPLKPPPATVARLADYEPVTDLGYTGDHSAKWETSILMALRPDLVEMDRLPTNPDEPLWGVSGLDPRVHATPEVGHQIVEAIVTRIGARAMELLAESTT
jgi:creatinine amidohydrolase